MHPTNSDEVSQVEYREEFSGINRSSKSKSGQNKGKNKILALSESESHGEELC